MKMQADSIYIDLSDTMNPKAITFPANYAGETGVMFHGFYMKTFSVDLPETWKTQSAAPKITLSNMIIDKMGITMKATATNIIQYPNAAVADMIASVDTVKVELIASSLVEAKIRGRIGLPFTQKSSTQNPLVYNALLSLPKKTAKGSFQLTIDPTGPINADLLAGTFTLDKTSTIKAVVDSTKKTFTLNLNGSLSWGKVDLGVIKQVNLGLKFQSLGLNYDSSNNKGLEFNKGSWSFASPQKKLANFPVSISDVGYQPLALQNGQLLHGKLTLDVIFNLTEDIGGKTQMGVEVAILNNQNGQKFYPKYLDTTIDKINVNANLPAVTINGAIEFRKDDPVFGNGFLGNLSADFKPLGVKISALAEFGNTNYQNGSTYYRYWRVEANATLPPPGVVFLPGVAFRGFGGGVYYNMIATQKNKTFTPDPNKKPYDFTPKKSSLGMSIMATMATSPKEEAFNGDLTLWGEFSTSNGLTFVTFSGDLWAGADLSTASRNKALVKGVINATYNHPTRHFNFSTQVNINAYPITTPNPISLVLDIRGKENKWFFKMGEPNNPNGVDVFGYYSYSYFMIGNDIPKPQGFTPEFANAFKKHVEGNPPSVGSGGVNEATQVGTGIAAGIGWKFSSDGEVEAAGFGVGYKIGAGAELHLALFDFSGACDSYNPVGINGWRAIGGLGFYGYADLHVIAFGEKVDLIGIGGGAWVIGEFPNPYYVAGEIKGYVRIFGFKPHLSIYFEEGTQCTNTIDAGPTQNNSVSLQQDQALQFKNNLITYVKLDPANEYPVDQPIIVKFGLTPDEPFDVAEQQANGGIINRTFRMKYSYELIYNEPTENNVIKTVELKTSKNNLGETIFTLAKPLGSANIIENFSNPSIGALPNLGTLVGAINPNTTMPANSGVSATQISVNNSRSRYFVPKYPPEISSDQKSNIPDPMKPQVFELLKNRTYNFTLTAKLEEFKDNKWTTAFSYKGPVISQTFTKGFNTGQYMEDPLDKAKQLPNKKF
jgi:hypothetical protein